MKRSIKRWNLKKIFVIAGVAAIVAGLAGCGGTKKDADKTCRYYERRFLGN